MKSDRKELVNPMGFLGDIWNSISSLWGGGSESTPRDVCAEDPRYCAPTPRDVCAEDLRYCAPSEMYAE